MPRTPGDETTWATPPPVMGSRRNDHDVVVAAASHDASLEQETTHGINRVITTSRRPFTESPRGASEESRQSRLCPSLKHDARNR
jgi:hypothetical protein